MTDIVDDPIKTKFDDIIKYRSNKVQWTRESAYKLGTMEAELLQMLKPYFDENNPRDREIVIKYKRIYRDVKEIYQIPDENLWLLLMKKDEDRILQLISEKLDAMGYLSTSRVIAPTTVHSDWDETEEEKAEREKARKEMLRQEKLRLIKEKEKKGEDVEDGI
jgi:hypothetical protein